MLTPDLVRIFICLVAVCNQCKGWIQNTHWIHWHFSFCSLYLHLSRGLMLVVLCSVLKKVVTMCYQNSKLVLGVLFVFYAGEIISPLWDL